MEYESTSQTSEDEIRRNRNDAFNYLPHSPNSRFEPRSKEERERYERELREQKERDEATKINNEPFIVPRKFSSNFQKLIREKTIKSITPTKNKFGALTDESEADIDDDDDEIGRIVKRRKKGHKFIPLNLEEAQGTSGSNVTTKTTEKTKNKNDATPKNIPSTNNTGDKTNKNKKTMPPIVIDGKTTNQRQLVQDLKYKAHEL